LEEEVWRFSQHKAKISLEMTDALSSTYSLESKVLQMEEKNAKTFAQTI
jgi:hypothetical protein